MDEQQLTRVEEAIAASLDRETALKYLEHKQERKRAIGKAALLRLGDSAADVILTRLAHEAAKRRRKTRMAYWAFGIYGGILVLFLFIWLGLGISTGSWREFPWQLFQLMNFMGIIGSVGAVSQFQKSATEVIAGLDDVKYVPALVDALEFNDKHLQSVAQSALTNLLPKLTASHSELLGDEQRKVLHRWLAVSKIYPSFPLAILKAMEQVGDARDLAVIQKLADSEASAPRERERRRAAQETLPYVQQRAEQHRISGTLLRAASASPDSSDLLRPASSGEADSGPLLRPVAPEPLPPPEVTAHPDCSEPQNLQANS